MSGVENPPAFPAAMIPEYQEGAPGMALRDWFAGQAIGAIIAATSAGQHRPDRQGDRISGMAGDAYDMADALLAERAKGGAA